MGYVVWGMGYAENQHATESKYSRTRIHYTEHMICKVKVNMSEEISSSAALCMRGYSDLT